MRRGTTPTITFNVPIDATQLTKLSIVFAQKCDSGKENIVLEKALADTTRTASTIAVTLTEAETLEFDADKNVEMQIRCAIGTTIYASNIMTTDVKRIIKDGAL